LDQFHVLPPGRSLVSNRGIEKTIANHPFSFIQGRYYHLFNVLSPIGCVEQKLCEGGESFVPGVEKDPPDIRTNSGPPWFQSRDHVDPVTLYEFFQTLHLGGLSTSLYAFESYKQISLLHGLIASTNKT
jgi:hypothetical protein